MFSNPGDALNLLWDMLCDDNGSHLDTAVKPDKVHVWGEPGNEAKLFPFSMYVCITYFCFELRYITQCTQTDLGTLHLAENTDTREKAEDN